MDWSDEGIFLSGKPLGEANLIAEMLTLEHGRHLGLVRGGRSRRVRPTLQSGNLVRVTWRARLADHLGGYNVELMEAHGARALDDPRALAAIGTLAEFVKLLPERDPHPELYSTTLHVLRSFAEPDIWPALLVYWEFQLLQELGFGLDLTSCAATGETEDLAYVSPKSGRAVSREAGAPYAARMLALPRFLVDGDAPFEASEIVAGFALTGFFLERDVLAPHGLKVPEARNRLLDLLRRDLGAA
ncbi:MAG: DNA repair protein RecO [Methyloceanibacter sp.]|uniref:DNA repair protein RecO n=1 Tax=Methyloceanibacter sp. TaxID=1965321 RepID=UPI001DF28F02|nr:DNA repair protein RecO [Methyloceanibacter sp.]MCB1442501.1 DNA repair protein RecO [Methyloceanibacter sp.]